MFKGSKMKIFVIVLVLVMIVSFSIAGILFYSEYGNSDFSIFDGNNRPSNTIEINDEKSHDLSDIDQITISTASDEINFILTDKNEIKAHYSGNCSAGNTSPKLSLKVVGKTLKINVDDNYIFGFFNIYRSLRLDIYIPKTYSGILKVDTASADINLGEIYSNEIKCETASGKITSTLAKAKSVILETVSGSIEVIIDADNVDLSSTSGSIISESIRAKNCSLTNISGRITLKGLLGDIDLSTVSGEIDLEYTKFANTIKSDTVSGKTTLKLPENSEFYLKFSTTSGNGKCEFPVTLNNTNSGNDMEGTVISDTNKISVESVSGDLNILK